MAHCFFVASSIVTNEGVAVRHNSQEQKISQSQGRQEFAPGFQLSDQHTLHRKKRFGSQKPWKLHTAVFAWVESASTTAGPSLRPSLASLSSGSTQKQ